MIDAVGVGWHPFAGRGGHKNDIGKTMAAFGTGVGHAVDDVTFSKPLLAHRY